MKLLPVVVLILGSCSAFVPVDIIPAIDYPTQDVRGVMDWVSEWLTFESDNGDLSVAQPWETYETGKGNCEDYTILAMYLLKRDIGVDSGMAVLLTSRGFHSMVAVDGDIWEPQIGLRVLATPLWIIPYDEAMAMAAP